MVHRVVPRTWRALALLACLQAAACSIFRSGPSEAELQAAQERREMMHRRLRDAVRGITTDVEAAGRSIAAQTDDIELKRQSVWYRMRAVEAARCAAWAENPVVGWLDLWALCLQTEAYLTDGDGSKLFGAMQHIVVDAARAQTAMIEEFLKTSARTQELYDRAREGIYQFVKENPMRGSFARIGISLAAITAERQKSWFAWVPTLDLNPFSGVGAGIDQGAAAIQEVGQAADRFTDIVDGLPRQLSWSIELLRYDIADDQLLSTTVGAVDRISRAAESIAETTKDLPGAVSAEVERTLAALEPRLHEVRATLGEAQAAAAALDRTGATFGSAAQSLEGMAAQLDLTLQTFNGTFRMLEGDASQTPDPAQPPEPPGKPFDVLEFDQTARSITAMAAQLDTTLQSLRQLVGDGQLDARVEQVGATTGTTVRQAIWTAAAAAAALLLLWFGLRLAYRRLNPASSPRAVREAATR